MQNAIRAARSLPLYLPLSWSFDDMGGCLSPRLGTSKAQIGCTMLAGWSLRNEGQGMSLLASPRHFWSLSHFLAAIFAFPASAQTGSTSTLAGAPAQTEVTAAPASSNPATPKTEPNAAGSDAAAPGTTNSTAPKADSAPGGSQPQSNPGPKAGSAVLININKAKQRMTVFLDGIQKYEWPVSTGRAGYSTPSGTYTATSMNEIWYSKEWDNSPMPHSIFFMKDGHAIHGS
jgi:L,D-transpeptidase catalytic domain